MKLVFDNSEPPGADDNGVLKEEWFNFYGNVEEELPLNMPEARGQELTILCFVDANHAGNSVTQRSHTGILIFVQKAPILWSLKRQNTVETSTFGSEMVAMQIAKEMIVALRYKLRMFRLPINGPARVYCNNQGAVKNTSIRSLTLAKKHNSIKYHTIQEAVAARIMTVFKEDTETNLADLFTKVLSRKIRNNMLSCIVYGPQFYSKDNDDQDKVKEPVKKKHKPS